MFTKAGYDQFLHRYDEQSKRDQDAFGMHIYSDFSGMEIVEVMGKQVRFSLSWLRHPRGIVTYGG